MAVKRTNHLPGSILIAILAIFIVSNPYTTGYLKDIHLGDTEVSGKKDKLLEQIEHAAGKYNTPSVDAKVDRVWKAMPGYNGVEVDVKRSYKNMADGTFDERKLIFKQLPPKVHLADLPPSPIYRGHPDKPMTSFLINVAWGEEYLPSMLATLKEHQVKATFFLEGRWAKEHPELVKRIAAEGHELGNHSYSHPVMAALSREKTHEELLKTNEVIEASVGKAPTWFGPPSGSYGEHTVKAAWKLGMRTVLWTVDTIDWQKPEPHILLDRVLAKVDHGSMILMHPTEPTAESLDQLIIEIRKRHLKIGTVTQLMDEEHIVKTNEYHD